MKKVLILLAALTSFLITGCFYNSDKEDMPKSNVTRATTGTITVYYDNPTWFATSNPINIHYNSGNSWTTVPGVAMTKITDQYATMSGWAVYSVSASSLTFCFNNGSTWDNNSSKNYQITEPGNYSVKNGVITKLGISLDIYMPIETLYPNYDYAGLPVSLYKDGTLYASSTVTYTTSHGIYATFKNVIPGDYTAVMNSELNSTYQGRIALKGNLPFTITSSMSYYSNTLPLTILPANVGWLGISFQVSNDSLSAMKESKIIGQSLKLYKDGIFVKDITITQYSYFTNEAYASAQGLVSGNYKAILNSTVNNVKYTGEISAVIDGTIADEKSVNISVTDTVPNKITIYYDNPTWFATPNPINIHYNAGNGWTAAPGVAMTKITSQYEYMGGWAVYSIDSSSLTFCFNNGSTWDNNSNKDYKITEPGNYTVKNGVITKL